MYQPINLAALPTPSAVQAFGFAALHDATIADAASRLQAAGIDYDVAALRGNPLNFVISSYAWREGLMRQRINEAVASTFLATAVEDADIELRAADVATVRADGEKNASLKARAQLAWEALATGGTYERYKALALSAAPVDLADVVVYGHERAGVPIGEVWIYCLGENASGVARAEVVAAVQAACSDRAARPVNDLVRVFAATPIPYTVEANLVLESGADPEAVTAAQRDALEAYAATRTKIGGLVTRSQISAVLSYNGSGLVHDLTLTQPLGNVGDDPFGAPVLAGVILSWSRRTP